MALTHFQYIRQVRQLLRDDSYPEVDITDALNRVLMDVNSMGRFRFHESKYTLNLAANTNEYACPSTVMAEKLFVYDLGSNNECEVPRRREPWTGTPIQPITTTTGDVPVEWDRYGNNWYIFPTPTTTMAANDVTVFYDKDLVLFLSPLDTTAIPDRHMNVLIYGAVVQLRPGLLIGAPEGQVMVETLYSKALEYMKRQELWNFDSIPRLRAGARFNNASKWGFVRHVRG